eukprot:Platyproteum_vivax@DN14362_c0_g1_i1.p1
MYIHGVCIYVYMHKRMSICMYVVCWWCYKEQFRSAEHHDAHEFFNYLVNDIADSLEKLREKDPNGTELQRVRSGGKIPPAKTWIHDLFEGSLVYETRCLCCENVTKRQEPFLDLSVEIKQNSSLTACITNFAAKEMLRADVGPTSKPATTAYYDSINLSCVCLSSLLLCIFFLCLGKVLL